MNDAASEVRLGDEERAKTIRLLRESQKAFLEAVGALTDAQSLKAVTREHPFPIFGTLSGYQWLLYIPLHNVRHNQQIDEVKSSDGFPRE